MTEACGVPVHDRTSDLALPGVGIDQMEAHIVRCRPAASAVEGHLPGECRLAFGSRHTRGIPPVGRGLTSLAFTFGTFRQRCMRALRSGSSEQARLLIPNVMHMKCFTPHMTTTFVRFISVFLVCCTGP